MTSQGGYRVLLSVLLAVLIAYPGSASDRAAGPNAVPFSDIQQAVGTLLRSGDEAVSGWERHERKRRRKRLIGALAYTAVCFAAAGMASSMAEFPTPEIANSYGWASLYTAEANFWLAWGTLVGGVGVIGATSTTRAALESACGYRGGYLSPAVQVAPEVALEFARGVPDASQRTRLLAAVLASAAMYAPDIAETTAEELVQAAAASKADDEDLKAVSLVAAACAQLGPDHPAVTACLDYLSPVLPVSAGKRPTTEKRQAAEVYAYLRPQEVNWLADTYTDPTDRAGILLAAAEGANRWGTADTGSLLDQAVAAATAIKDMPGRAEALAAIAVSGAAGNRREALISQAVAATRDQRRSRPDTESVRKVALQLARYDPVRALSILTEDDQPMLGFDFAQSMAPVLLAHPPGRVHADLVKRLPHRKEMAPFFHQLTTMLSASGDPSLAAAAQEAAQSELEIAYSLKDKPWRRPYVLAALSDVASIKPELGMEALPGAGEDAVARAAAHFRVVRGFAARAARDPQSAAGSKDTATAVRLLKAGLGMIPSADDMKWYYDLVPEIGPAFVAVYRLSPSDAIALARNAPAGPVRAEALLQCGIQEALSESPQANAVLTDAVAAAQIGGNRETVEVMVSRASVGLGLVAPDKAEQLLDGVYTHWARAGALVQTAQLRDEAGGNAWLATLSQAHAAATKESYAAERAQAIYWIMDAAAAPPDCLKTMVQQTGLPWLVPVSASR